MVKKRKATVHGVLLVDKPVGVTSFDVVRQVCRTLGTKKCGHTGTLDPFASGLLCLCFGEATKMVQYLMADEKEYLAELRLGTETDSCDCEGTIVEETDIPEDIATKMRTALPDFTGQIEQKPPVFSAVKVDGKRLYEYARKGEPVEIPSRTVHVKDLELFEVEDGCAQLRVVCGKGTYIRSLGRDLAISCGTVGHLTGLRRTRLGPWNVKEAVSPDASEEALLAAMMTSTESLNSFPQFAVEDEIAKRIGWGQRIAEGQLPPAVIPGKTMLARDQKGLLLAVVRLEEGVLAVERGFSQPW